MISSVCSMHADLYEGIARSSALAAISIQGTQRRGRYLRCHLLRETVCSMRAAAPAPVGSRPPRPSAMVVVVVVVVVGPGGTCHED